MQCPITSFDCITCDDGCKPAAKRGEVVLQARNQTIADLVQQCADGKLPFSGPDSLCSKVSAMGSKTTSLYEMVLAAERSPDA